MKPFCLRPSLILLCLMMVLLSGCAVGLALHNSAISSDDTPFYLAYGSDEVIRDQSKVATITADYDLTIDDVKVSPENMRSANYHGGWVQSAAVVDVLPGVHTVQLILPPRLGGYAPPITHDFKAGQIYNVALKMILVEVEENNSADVAEKIAAHRNKAVFEQKRAR